MRFIDPTIYASRRSVAELEIMRTAGLMGIVEPTTWLGTDRHFPETFLDDFERAIGPEARRALQLGIGYAACVGVTAKEANNQASAHRVIEAMPRFLGHERVVGIGEIGLERGTPAEEDVFRRQLRLAQHYGLPVVVQIPSHDRRDVIARTITVLREEGIPTKNVLINGVTEETLPVVRQYGCWYGLTIDRNTHISPERAVHLLHQIGIEGAMIHSAAGRLHGDPLAVPKTARLMLETGFSPDEIEKLTFHNPKWFFSQAKPMPLPELGRTNIGSRFEPSAAYGNPASGAPYANQSASAPYGSSFAPQMTAGIR